MGSKNNTNIPSQTFSWRTYCSAATGTVSFCLLSSWHGCRLQDTVGIVSRTGTAVGCSSPSSPWAAKQQPQPFFTSGWRMQYGDARRPGNPGYHSGIALIKHTFICWTRAQVFTFLALLTVQQPLVKCSSRFQGSLLTGSVHVIPPFSWILWLADGDSGLKQRYYKWILSCSLCSSCIPSIKPVLLPSPARKWRSHGKHNQTLFFLIFCIFFP